MSSEALKLLSFGSKESFEQLIQLGALKFTLISKFVLERIPDEIDLTDVLIGEELKEILEGSEIDSTSRNTVLLTIYELWRNIAYYQPKLQPLLESLKEAGFDHEMRDTVVQIWSDYGFTLSEKLRSMSFSGRPCVNDIGWTLRMCVASSDNPTMHDVEAILQFDTDQGLKICELNKDKLVELYTIIQEVQRNLDVLLKKC
ncbi:unnamed protein product [Thelazia callipaeda]|uniref:COMM domain-containing protein n=1 Tax=Thelazia callipaeda TaxID=103827 RepID=A0A0N5CPB8_THECL|nr:unnamed protein product [Thelazia callipaeda]